MDAMLGMSEACWCAEGLADNIQGIPDLVVKDLLAVDTAKEVVPIRVQSPLAGMARLREKVLGQYREAKLALEEGSENIRLESVVGAAAVVSGKGEAGEGTEDGGEGNGDGFRGCSQSGVQGSRGSTLVQAFGESGKVSLGHKFLGSGRGWLCRLRARLGVGVE